MKMSIAIAFCTACISLIGCASAPQEAKVIEAKVADAKPGERRNICQREKPTGSHMPVTVCRTAEELELDKQSVDALRNQMSSAPRTISGGNETRGR